MASRQEIDLRRWGIPEVPMLGRYDYRAANTALLTHAHPHTMEICYLAKGRQLYRVGRQDYVLTGGDLFVTLPGEAHSSGETPEEKGTLYWLQLLLPRSSRRLFNCPHAESRALRDKLLHLPHRHFAGSREMPRILDAALAAAAQADDPLHRITIRNRLIEFLLLVIAASQHQPRASISRPISDLLRIIEGRADERLTLSRLASRIGLSLPRFKARFKEEVGIPPAEYVMRCKIEAAKECLARPGATVTSVAFEMNFSSSQYFATVFRRYTGQTPHLFQAATR